MGQTNTGANMRVIPAMVFSRICGYFSPVYIGDKPFLWSKGKTSEFNDRVSYKIPENLNVKTVDKI